MVNMNLVDLLGTWGGAVSKTIKGEELTIFDMPPRNSIKDYSIDEIKQIVAAGKAPEFWKVGDIVGPVNLNGSLGGLTLNYAVYFVIIGFDHNKTVETPNYHTMTLTTCNSSGTKIAFIGDRYNSKSDVDGFHIWYQSVYTADWSGCPMRNNLCPQFKQLLPLDWQNAIVPCIKPYVEYYYLDTTTISDEIFIFDTTELKGDSGSYMQYEYFKNGGSCIFYSYKNTSEAVRYCTRRAPTRRATYFSVIEANGDVSRDGGIKSLGFTPVFNIGIAS